MLSFNVAERLEILIGIFIQGANPCEINKDMRREAYLDDVSAKSMLKSPINTSSDFSVKCFLKNEKKVSE